MNRHGTSQARLKTTHGSPRPLGATWDGRGVNFAVYSENAQYIELCLYAPGLPETETGRIKLESKTHNVHHAYVRGLGPGQLYGYRAYGPYDPPSGQRFNPAKLLVDPYARAISGAVMLDSIHHDHKIYRRAHKLVIDSRDSAAYMPKSVVVDGSFDWGGDSPPGVPWSDTVIYEAHVRGLTMLHPEVPGELRGTYAGLASPDVISHLRSLGVTAVELMPVHHSVSECRLLENGLVNYWGYNTLGFFAPDIRYSRGSAGGGRPGGQVNEFKEMVKALHKEGFEVILDVVYNHTCEGGSGGPTLSLRGLDNKTYYRLDPGKNGDYLNFTGTGNTINSSHPAVVKLIFDSLRYWAEEMRVDGFRLDLAPVLFRNGNGFDRSHPLFKEIAADPVLSGVKLIAEPWDLGPGGYQTGGFPDPWSEWNDRYRNTVRRFWRSDEGVIPDMAYRISGSSDLYGTREKGSYASINYVASHDGFTLSDLVLYEHKHNEANLEDNADGNNANYAFNFGVEGPSDDAAIIKEREKQKRNFLATLFLSQGVPMLLMGDEAGRTQRGNNNAYCQDNETSWMSWGFDARGKKLLLFTRFLAALRKSYPVLRRGIFFTGVPHAMFGHKDLSWFLPDAREMTDADWQNPRLRSISIVKVENTFEQTAKPKKALHDNALMLLLNAEPNGVVFTVPDGHISPLWQVIFDTSRERPGGKTIGAGKHYTLAGRSLALLKPSAKTG
ncbi:MAG TPA: glycogen debranching protein GlgX [Thermodesulfobacteriota bacterium]|nr:glycogen debranching protein GlgX [Thermodesulfobacteriota bacterium]